MALSASESALLTETCTNMNVAANTCREVLEMLRSLGNTGVVDIATHNNASTPHANATNLMHLDNGVAYLGTKVTLEGAWSNRYPFRIAPNGLNGYGFDITSESQGVTSYPWMTQGYAFAFTDSSHTLYTDTGMSSVFGINPKALMIACNARNYDNTVNAAIAYHMGQYGGDLGYACSSITLWLQKSDTYQPVFEFGPDWFAPYKGSLRPSLGSSGKWFDTAYLASAPIVGSDRRLKTSVDALGDKAVRFVNALRPVSYKVAVAKTEILETDENGEAVRMEERPGARTHWGFIAQEVKDAMTQANIEDAAAWTLADKNDPESMQSLRYEELIAPLVKAVQVLAAKVEALEGK